MSYDDDNPEIFYLKPDDQLLISELIKDEINSFPDLIPWFENESDNYEEIINQDLEHPYDE